MKNICRTCMKEEERMVSVFSDVEHKSLIEMLTQCASVQVTGNYNILIC